MNRSIIAAQYNPIAVLAESFVRPLTHRARHLYQATDVSPLALNMVMLSAR